MNNRCSHIREKGEFEGLQCDVILRKDTKRLYCGKHHKILYNWFLKDSIKNKTVFDENVLYKNN